jgi:hypothetical protein
MKVNKYAPADDEGSEVPLDNYHDNELLDRAGDKQAVEGEDDDDTETSSILKGADNTDQQTKRRRMLLIGGAILLVAGAVIGSYFLATYIKSQKSASEHCELPIKDVREPLLEFNIEAGSFQRELNAAEIDGLERAITDGYNAASGGCTDEFKRFMVGSVLKQQSVVDNTFENGENSAIAVEFDAQNTLLLQFETVISCDGCAPDNAFASKYPSSYDSGRRELRKSTLDAAVIMEEIERRVKDVVPELGDIIEAKIAAQQDGGVAQMKLRTFDVSTTYSYGDEMVSYASTVLTYFPFFIYLLFVHEVRR